MKELIASHKHNIYLKPGEVVVTRTSVLVTTVLGSCVAVTMFSPSCGVGAICHAMLPDSCGRSVDLRYVDAALEHIYQKVVEYGAGGDLVVKMFGGARVLDLGSYTPDKHTVGELNVARTTAVLASLGLRVSSSDVGGQQGRKLVFCTRNGDVYLRRMMGRRTYSATLEELP